jgi:PTS system nitrogen regulatory IIA component
MNIAEILPLEAVLPDLQADTQETVLAELVAPLIALHPELNRHDLMHTLCERERMGSTAVGEGVAIPHGKVAGLEVTLLVVGRSRDGILFHAPDNKPCHIFFLILTPEHGAGQHLRLLAQIVRRAKEPVFRSEILLAENREQIRQAVIAP